VPCKGKGRPWTSYKDRQTTKKTNQKPKEKLDKEQRIEAREVKSGIKMLTITIPVGQLIANTLEIMQKTVARGTRGARKGFDSRAGTT